MTPPSGSPWSALAAGWRVLRRHLRYAAGNPRKLLWVARRAWQIVAGGQLRGVLRRHAVIGEFYADYPAWAAVQEVAAARRVAHWREVSPAWPWRPRFSVLVPLYEPPREFLEAALRSVLEQEYPHWELCLVDDASPGGAHLPRLEALAAADPRVRLRVRAQNGGIAAATNDALASATGDFCLFLDQDDVLHRSALFEFAARVAARPDVTVLYADEDRIDAEGNRSRPNFKPDWDPEWLRTTNCIMHPVAVRTAVLRELGGLREGIDGVQDWDLLLRLDERMGRDAVEHVPRVLYHWREHPGSTAAGIYEKSDVTAAQERALREAMRRRGEAGEVRLVDGAWRIQYALPQPPPLASLVIPTRDRAALLQRCVSGLRERTHYPRWEAVIVDNGSVEPAALALLDSLAPDPRFRVVRADGEFNYAALCNRGVAEARGEVVVLYNNDVDPIAADWLAELVSHAIRPGIGLAGALLYYPDDTIQHAGVVLGLNGVADRPYLGYPRGFRGVDSRLFAVHSVSAMITACAAVRRAVYGEAGGMDESLRIDCNDIDLCLRIAALGYRNVLSPHAQLYHLESASRGYHYGAPGGRALSEDEIRFQEKWRGRLGPDPAYNPNLALTGSAYSLGPADRGETPADLP